MSEPESTGESRPTRSPGSFLLKFLVCLILAVGFVWLLPPPAVDGPRAASRKLQCLNNMKNVALAMQNYQTEYGCFPPAYVADEKGRPMHSWRVLILPYLDQVALHRQYDFAEPWNGPNNSKLHDILPTEFRCPADADAGAQDTNYVVVSGPATLFPGSECTKHGDITDKLEQTIMLVEMAGSGIHWMEPRDLHVRKAMTSFNEPPGRGISSQHHGDVNVVFADGRVVSISNDLDAETIKAMLTIAGGEEIEVP